MFTLNSLLHFIILLVLFHTVNVSLLSRLKNPTRYEPTDEVIILPQDYYVDNIAEEYSFTSAESDVQIWTDIPTRKVSSFSEEELSQMPTKEPNNSVTNNTTAALSWLVTLTEQQRPTELEIWTIPENYFKSRKTTELALVSVENTTQYKPNALEEWQTIHYSKSTKPTVISSLSKEPIFKSTKTWRPYFQNTPVFRNRNQFFETSASVWVKSSSFVPTRRPYLYEYYVKKYSQQNVTTNLPESTNLNKNVIKVLFRAKDLESEFKPEIIYPVKSGRKKKQNALRKQKRKPKPKRSLVCYFCGLTVKGLSNSDCYDMFNNAAGKKRPIQDCSRSAKRYKNGCFTRWLDVGTGYVERGCRTWLPQHGKSYASKLLVKIELMLRKYDVGCAFSPAAVLTPFSRAISLYVRYHVCVCQGRYCNAASRPDTHLLIWTMCFIINFVHFYFD